MKFDACLVKFEVRKYLIGEGAYFTVNKISSKRYKKTRLWQEEDYHVQNTETQVSLDFAETCKYISQEEYRELRNKSEEVGRMLNHMVKNPEKYRPKQ